MILILFSVLTKIINISIYFIKLLLIFNFIKLTSINNLFLVKIIIETFYIKIFNLLKVLFNKIFDLLNIIILVFKKKDISFNYLL